MFVNVEEPDMVTEPVTRRDPVKRTSCCKGFKQEAVKEFEALVACSAQEAVIAYDELVACSAYEAVTAQDADKAYDALTEDGA